MTVSKFSKIVSSGERPPSRRYLSLAFLAELEEEKIMQARKIELDRLEKARQEYVEHSQAFQKLWENYR